MTKALKLQSAKETIIVTQKELKDKYGEKVRNIYLNGEAYFNYDIRHIKYPNNIKISEYTPDIEDMIKRSKNKN